MNNTEKLIQTFRDSKRDGAFIYYNLFSLLYIEYPDFLDEVIENYKELKDCEGEWFRIFHKQFRQIDVFNDERIMYGVKVITDAELKERDDLLSFRANHRKQELDETDEDYVTKGQRLATLNYKMNTYKRGEEHIGGHLDSIFHQTISKDNGVCYEVMNEFLSKL